MECCICHPWRYSSWSKFNTICAACYGGVRTINTLANKYESDKGNDISGSTTLSLPTTVNKGFANAVKRMKDMEENLNEKISYLSGFAAAFREEIHPDIEVKPGGNQPSIPAHRALLVVRSNIFRNILDSGECKDPPSQEIMLPELNHEELESLLEFLYSGNLPKEKAEKHIYSLSIAADKYEIPFLKKFCEQQMLGSLSLSNALDVLEISDICSSQCIKETALNFIVANMKNVVSSSRFEAFVLKNPALTVEITRRII